MDIKENTTLPDPTARENMENPRKIQSRQTHPHNRRRSERNKYRRLLGAYSIVPEQWIWQSSWDSWASVPWPANNLNQRRQPKNASGQLFDYLSTRSHSLRTGEAMTVKLNKCNLILIMKTGRWTSPTFLTCIHKQIAHLGTNIFQCMANPVPCLSF